MRNPNEKLRSNVNTTLSRPTFVVNPMDNQRSRVNVNDRIVSYSLPKQVTHQNISPSMPWTNSIVYNQIPPNSSLNTQPRFSISPRGATPPPRTLPLSSHSPLSPSLVSPLSPLVSPLNPSLVSPRPLLSMPSNVRSVGQRVNISFNNTREQKIQGELAKQWDQGDRGQQWIQSDQHESNNFVTKLEKTNIKKLHTGQSRPSI